MIGVFTVAAQLAALGTAAGAFAPDTSGGRIQAPTSAPWQRPFSLVAGGGTSRPAPGVVAGDANLGRVRGGARDGAGRVIVDATSGMWLVQADGRLARLGGVGQAGLRDASFPRAMTVLPDGRVAIADGKRVVTVAPGATSAVLLATAQRQPEALGVNASGALIGLSRQRVLVLRGNQLDPAGGRLPTPAGIAVGGVDGGLLAVSGSPGSPDSPTPPTTRFDLVAPEGIRQAGPAPRKVAGLRSAALLTDGRVLLATEPYSYGEIDTTPIFLAAGPTVDEQPFDFGVGEEFYGWMIRRIPWLRDADGRVRSVRWAGPPAEGLAPDGPSDVLVASAGRLWTTTPGLGAPQLVDGRVAIRLGTPASVQIAVRSSEGVALATTPPTALPTGRTLVALPEPLDPGTVRITVTASSAGTTQSASAWAFSRPGRFTPQEADRVLSVVAQRTNVGFEGAIAHGVDRCAARSATVVRCRWTTAGTCVRSTVRAVRLEHSASGYAIRAGRPRPEPEEGRNTMLLGAPFEVEG